MTRVAQVGFIVWPPIRYRIRTMRAKVLFVARVPGPKRQPLESVATAMTIAMLDIGQAVTQERRR